MAAAALAGGGVADAKVFQAESVLPPGQSGFVSVPGVAMGTGSPHLADQNQLFIDFGFKSALFGQPGPTETPRPGVSIVRGPYGVPSITGSTDFNAWFGVGYAVAQDRLFQLELFRRAGSGRLAEIVGEDFLDDDLIARRDYYTDAELDAMIAGIPPNLRSRAEAYRDGINAWVEEVRKDPSKLPGEFAALQVDLPTWTLRDTARIGILLARTVPSGDGAEIENARALREIGSKAFDKLLPLRTKGRVATVPEKAGIFPSQPGRTVKQERRAFLRTRRFLKGLPLPDPPKTEAEAEASEARGGSYMWGIGRKRPTGRKLRGASQSYLFNGPQLGFSIPELFVEFELHSPVQN
nr:penicillin acylase family protein [Thermoleophilaceae bacterium]